MKSKDYSLKSFFVSLIVTGILNFLILPKLIQDNFGFKWILNILIGAVIYLLYLGYRKSEESNEYGDPIEKNAIKSFDNQDFGSALLAGVVIGAACIFVPM